LSAVALVKKQPEPIKKVMPALTNIIQANLVRNFVRNEKSIAVKQEPPKGVINFYPRRDEAAALKYIHLDDCSSKNSKYFLVDKPDGSCSMLKLSEEVHAKKLLVKPRQKRHSR
jgi:hypothetical protein